MKELQACVEQDMHYTSQHEEPESLVQSQLEIHGILSHLFHMQQEMQQQDQHQDEDDHSHHCAQAVPEALPI